MNAIDIFDFIDAIFAADYRMNIQKDFDFYS